MTISFYSFLLLILVLSFDTFTAGLSYGIEKVYVPPISLITIAVISGFTFTLSLKISKFLLPVFSEDIANLLSFLALLILALYKLYDSIPHPNAHTRSFTTAFLSDKINGPDIHILSFSEAALLSITLSIDSITAGISTPSAPISLPFVFLLSSLFHFFAALSGILCGNVLQKKTSCHFTFLGALILLLLACMRFFHQ